MNWPQTAWRPCTATLPLLAGVALAMAGCASAPNVNPFAAGGVNPNSTVAAEVVAESHAPGGYPRISQTPVVPTDVRPVPQWRLAVVSEWQVKRQTEREAAAIPFTLAGTEAWAQHTRSKIPAGETSKPTPDVSQQSEAFAAAARARATPPPPPQ